ncbi:pyridoxal 5'-phosphate synthase glutaminase subunit PdxT [Rothia sp. ZJ932]|nr:pyridoxal 5'-phosphate synthase glutaminase subunit PdxT [Rothia sp. ZJ932]
MTFFGGSFVADALVSNGKTVGVLALQGGVAEHAAVLERLGARVVLVKKPEHLVGLDALVLPGGESSTIDRLTRIFGLREPLIDTVESGLPTLGTCAGLIMLAREIDDSAPGQQSLGVLDVSVGRNAFGSQVDSAEAVLDWQAVAGEITPVKTVFIRAPRISRVGGNVVITAKYRGEVVGVRQGNIIGISFHPELTGDTRVHEELLALV